MSRERHLANPIDALWHGTLRACYELKHPEHHNDEILAWELATEVLRHIADGKELPSHQYSSTYQRVLAFMEAHAGERSSESSYWWLTRRDNDVVDARLFRWSMGDILPVRQGKLDENEFLRRLKKQVIFQKVVLTGVWLPTERRLAEMTFASLFRDSQGAKSEAGNTIMVPFEKEQQEFDFSLLPFATPLSLRGALNHLQVEEDGRKIAISSDGEWRTFYFLTDLGSTRCFFSRERNNSGRRTPRSHKHAVPEFDNLLAGLAPA